MKIKRNILQLIMLGHILFSMAMLEIGLRKISGYQRGFSEYEKVLARERRSVLPLLDSLLRLKNVGLSTLIKLRNIKQPNTPPPPPQPIILFIPAPPPHLSPTRFSLSTSGTQQSKGLVRPIHDAKFPNNQHNSMQYDEGSPDIPMVAPPYEKPAPIVPYQPIYNQIKPLNQGIVPFYQPDTTTRSALEVPQSIGDAFSPTYIAPNDDPSVPFSIPSIVFEKEYVSFPTMEELVPVAQLPALDVTSDLQEFFRSYKNRTHLYNKTEDDINLQKSKQLKGSYSIELNVEELPLPYYENFKHVSGNAKIRENENIEPTESSEEEELSNLFPYYKDFLDEEIQEIVEMKKERSTLNINEQSAKETEELDDTNFDYEPEDSPHILLPFY